MVDTRLGGLEDLSGCSSVRFESWCPDNQASRGRLVSVQEVGLVAEVVARLPGRDRGWSGTLSQGLELGDWRSGLLASGTVSSTGDLELVSGDLELEQRVGWRMEAGVTGLSEVRGPGSGDRMSAAVSPASSSMGLNWVCS